MALTITEALAEIKTIDKRIAAKRDYVSTFIARQEGIKDPLAKEGGSETVIAREIQGIRDLGERKVALRAGINDANNSNAITVNGNTRTIANWLTWRRDVAPEWGKSLDAMRVKVKQARDSALRAGHEVVTKEDAARKPTDVVVSINESKLAEEIEWLTDTLGQLDGQLSLKNATTTISV